jgi:hypothetical protein
MYLWNGRTGVILVRRQCKLYLRLYLFIKVAIDRPAIIAINMTATIYLAHTINFSSTTALYKYTLADIPTSPAIEHEQSIKIAQQGPIVVFVVSLSRRGQVCIGV